MADMMTKGKIVPDQFGPVIPWAGGECPVHPSAIVRLHFRGRNPYVGTAFWDGMPPSLQPSIWLHAPAPGRSDPNCNVIAYQVMHG